MILLSPVAHSLLTNITGFTYNTSICKCVVSQLKWWHSLKGDEITVYSTHTSKYKEGILTLLKPRLYCRIYVHSKCYQYVCTWTWLLTKFKSLTVSLQYRGDSNDHFPQMAPTTSDISICSQIWIIYIFPRQSCGLVSQNNT